MSKLSYGVKEGIIFGILGIPLSFIVNTVIAIQLELFAEKFSYNIWDFSFYVSFLCLLISLLGYLLAIFLKKKQRQALIIFFLVNIAFLNVCLFYNNYAYSTDGQIAFALFQYPLKTAILYPIFGAFHEWIQDKTRISNK